MEEKTPARKSKEVRLRVFCPNARALSTEEIETIPAEKRRTAEAQGKEGVWLEIPFAKGGGRAQFLVEKPAAEAEKGEGFWMRLFCPEERCEIEGPSDLP